jgi:arabinofuranosyltransferase
MKNGNKSILLLLISFAVAILIFLKNAWVSEDAYILFRSLEQFIAGNGPVWNPHERVQVYTSPLWYFVLVIFRLFSKDVYLNAIIISFILWLSTVLVIKKIFKNNSIFFLSILLLSASTAFFDYTSSGLENVLAYLLIAIYFLNYFGFSGFSIPDKDVKPELRMKITLLMFGLILILRHDLALLLLPPTIYVVSKNSTIFSNKQWFLWIIISLSPFILFTLFSLIYYGSPFPNSAYAKLNIDFDKIKIYKQGIKYILSSLKYDIITLGVISGALVIIFFVSANNYIKYIGYGIILNLMYVVIIGGDFMQGRFFSYSFLVSVIILLLWFSKVHSRKSMITTTSLVFVFLLFYPHTPFNSPLNYENRKQDMGIADERGFYFKHLSLNKYIFRDKDNNVFPNNNLAAKGIKFKEATEYIIIEKRVGIFGYYSGTDKIIIDPLAITDPLLARMPVPGWSRIGHFRREIPPGYINSVSDGTEVIEDPMLNEFYNKVRIITQDTDLFALQRIKTIILFNLGFYNHLLPR